MKWELPHEKDPSTPETKPRKPLRSSLREPGDVELRGLLGVPHDELVALRIHRHGKLTPALNHSTDGRGFEEHFKRLII